MPVALTLLLWLGWLAVGAASLGLTAFAFAFADADAPELSRFASRRVGWVSLVALVALPAGAALLAWRGGWWQGPAAYLLAAAPLVTTVAATWLFAPSGSVSASPPPWPTTRPGAIRLNSAQAARDACAALRAKYGADAVHERSASSARYDLATDVWRVEVTVPGGTVTAELVDHSGEVRSVERK